jgi:hypothetical protein
LAFGYKTTTGDFLPIVKYDARAGRFFKVDKEPGQQGVETEIPPGTKFAIDIGTLEAGWVTFGAQGPVRHMRPYIEGDDPIPQPQDKDSDGKMLFRPGFYVKLAGNALGGVREWIGASAAVMNAMDDLYQQIIRAPEAATGKIPIVSIPSTIAIKSGSGARASTNYAPLFRVEGWTDRPDVLGPRTVPVPRAGSVPVNVPVSQMPPAQVAAMAAASVHAQQGTARAARAPAMADSEMPF